MVQLSITAEHISDLRWLLPGVEISSGASVLDLHSRDESHHPPRRPELVIWPTETHQVATLLRFASDRGLAVTPWAGGTSLEGNPVPARGGIVLDFTRMDRVLAVREQDLQADVQPGVPYKQLNRTLAAHGLFFPPDPGGSGGIGGMIGNNASGGRTVAYGGTNFEQFARRGLTRMLRLRDSDFQRVAGQTDQFSVRWTGYLRVDEPDAYQLGFVSDDGFRMWLDGRKIFDVWKPGSPNRGRTPPGLLTKGYHRVTIEFFDQDGDAYAALYWRRSGRKSEVIPASAFFHAVVEQ